MFERKRMYNDEVPIRFVDIMGFMQYTGLGRSSAMKLGKKIGCGRKMGKRVIYDLNVADDWFDSHDTFD